MKLKNKLLPLVGIGAACAAVTPIALTSCKNNSNGFMDLTQNYALQYQPVDGSAGPYSTSQVESFYFQELQKNPNILADDLYWTYSFMNRNYYTATTASSETSANQQAAAFNNEGQLEDNIENLIKINSLKLAVVNNIANTVAATEAAVSNSTKLTASGDSSTVSYITNVDNEKIENISAQSITYGEGEDQEIIWLLSFKRSFELDYNEATSSKKGGSSSSKQSNYVETGTIEYHNIPFCLELIQDQSTTETTTIGANCWKVKMDIVDIDDSEFEEYAELWAYLMESEEYASYIDVNASIDVVTVADSGKKTTDSDIYEFKIDSDLTYLGAYELYEYQIMSRLQPNFVSHYVWNLGWNGKA